MLRPSAFLAACSLLLGSLTPQPALPLQDVPTLRRAGAPSRPPHRSHHQRRRLMLVERNKRKRIKWS